MTGWLGRCSFVLCSLAAGGPLAGQTAPAAPLTTFGYDRTAPLELADSLLRVEEGVAIHAISFASPRGGRATGLLFVPSGPGPFAGIVVQHGAPGRIDSALISLLHQSVMPNAMAVAKAGAVAIALDAPWARKLVPPVTFTPADSGYQVQLIVDLQRAVDVLIARRDVDPARLGYVGRSYGGAQGALFAGVERRVRTFVLQVGDGGLVSHFTGADGTGGPPPGFDKVRWDRWIAAIWPIEPIRFVGGAKPATLLLQSGRNDEAVPAALAAKLHQAASEPKTVTWYDTGHALNDAARTDMLRWFHDKLGTRAP